MTATNGARAATWEAWEADLQALCEPEPLLQPATGRPVLGISWEAWELLDRAVRDALREGRLAPAELPLLAGWLDGVAA